MTTLYILATPDEYAAAVASLYRLALEAFTACEWRRAAELRAEARALENEWKRGRAA